MSSLMSSGKREKTSHSLTIGHKMRHDWWECLKEMRQCSLTRCCQWLWDETWLMRLLCKEIKKCHSLPVGHGMIHDWWDWERNDEVSTHLLLVMRWHMIDENALKINKPLLLTACWSWDETSYEGIVLSPTHCWSWDQTWWNCLPKKNVYSHSVCWQGDYLGLTGRE